MINIAYYGSHNASYVVEQDGEIKLVLEVERFLNYKNSGIAQYLTPKPIDILFLAQYIPQYLLDKFNIDKFDNCLYLNTDVIIDGNKYDTSKFIPAKNYIEDCTHHQAHAAGTFYQSPYDEALVFSFDGGGNDGKFNVYHASRKDSVKLLETVVNPTLNNPHIYYDLGFPYMLFGEFLNDIRHEGTTTGNLVYPGKLMGLASYGKVKEEWLPFFIEFYKSDPNGARVDGWGPEGYWQYEGKLKVLGEKIGVTFTTSNRLEGDLAYSIAATSQRAFEECFLEVAKPYFKEYNNLPICITGGCGLNIILNTRLVNEFNRDVFVGPNPNDCGIATGIMLNFTKPELPANLTYSGTELLDKDSLGTAIQNSYCNFKSYTLDIDNLVNDLKTGKIVGVARGKSEHGPRALGNRSIICNPSIDGMKDILNEKVKNREWYRPFAPVVRLEDVDKYFEWNKESRWMSFCPKVKKEWRKKLGAIVHVDNTARVQTVTHEQNPWLYELLTKFEKETGIGVLLNTSFNVAGKPILSTVSDAFEIFEKTQMDCLLIENSYFKKL